MATYRIIRGKHSQIEPKEGGRGKNVKRITRRAPDGQGGFKDELVGYRKTYAALVQRRRGDVVVTVPQEGFSIEDQFIDSELDLVAMFGAGKYERISVPTDQAIEHSKKESSGDDLEDMTTDELKRFAAEEEIDLGGITRKAEMIRAIRAELGTVKG